MTAKKQQSAQVTLWEFFQLANLHVTRGIIVVLRHYARHW